MKPFRISIAATLSVVAVIAVGLMGLREGTELWASLSFGVMLLFLIGATLVTLLRPVEGGAGWTGFAVVGWVYFALNFGPWPEATPPPPTASKLVWRLLGWLRPAHSPLRRPLPLPGMSRGELMVVFDPATLKPGETLWAGDATHFRQSAHAMGTLFFGAIGAFWGRWLARAPSRLDRSPPPP